MQLYVKGGAVVAYYLDGQAVPDGSHPGASLQAYAGEMSALGRIGELPAGWPAMDPDPRPYAAPPIDLKAYAASARYAKETAGITVGTAPVATDRDSQGMITGMWAAAQINPNISVSFKSGSGFVTIGATQVARIAAAVAGYVQACFTAEAQVAAGIAAGTITTPAAIDAAFAAVVTTFAGTAAAGASS